ncbi:MAG: hypothetical protein H3C47_10745 [Candidatus Cloacimonetes bacterium]|nr:hypothetical protein [Candidatus Cloacimonadota bacterium]
MLDKEFIQMLCCPETRQPLTEVNEEFLKKLNQMQSSGSLLFVTKAPVPYPLSSALIREDGQKIYPVREGIPVLLREEGIPTPVETA